jgi:hypothetical protein
MYEKRWVAWLATILLPGAALGDPPPCAPDHTMARAGYPQEISHCARPSETHAYVGYYVGGGSPCLGDHRFANEGTWGWDYQGCLIPRKVFLCWWHGRCYQGGTGAYKTDGPHLPEKEADEH